MTELLQIVFDALSLGSLYALGALGIALIFGVMRLVNFAHGDFIAFCVFAMLWPINAAAIVFAGNLPFYLLIPLLLLVGGTLSVLSEAIVFRRFRNANPATMMIASFALGFAIRNFLLMMYSSRPKSITLWPSLSLPVEVLGARIPMLQVVTIIITLAVLAALTLFLKRTRYGLEMRAAAENFTMARMLGVRANAVILLAFAISGMLACGDRADPGDQLRHGGYRDGRQCHADRLHRHGDRWSRQRAGSRCRRLPDRRRQRRFSSDIAA
jgi:branched-chain amino acid transport system permease protein